MKDIFKFNKISSNLITKHHHLSPYDTLKNEYKLSYSESEYITEGWENDVIITTFVQLFESLFTNKNKLIRKFHNLINSIIILDEIQSIPPRFYPVLEIIFAKMAEYFGTRFIFVTATQPIIMSGENKLIELSHGENNSLSYFFKDMSRVEINQKLFRNKIGYEETKSYINDDIDINENNSFLIILNTIKQAQDVHSSIISTKTKYFLSSEILPILRRKVLENVKDSSNKILISTQVVEAGVDLDFDIVYRDFAPLSSINQSAGRCNRNGVRNKGIVNIFNSNKSNIYDSSLLSITRNLLADYEEIIKERDLFELNNKYFEEIKLSIQKDSNISIKLYNSICKLQFEDIDKEFVLIKDLPIYYDVFIPFNSEAKRLWKKYIKIINETEGFGRRKKIKEIQPYLLDYVTKFPKKHYHPNNDSINNTIIYADDWEDYYDLKTGFKYNKTQENESGSICI
jgi:CRISPR-associated endonuclease/helicase Cas3